ncbi:intermembrane transport protein PqiB [Thiocystis violascens]|uniref:Qaraquat-inducible protein B n=1 Tax=Thiocystis violascens (strain ATCC 17096 / DSM 198 / 6111) TaxID=765911 RepID=I3Y552_THIV6|nr:MlaD family protein [Thiocystis violascens]AFL72120.1 qaraquat-inducible protein B [Thiocystis violascens DSM 198]
MSETPSDRTASPPASLDAPSEPLPEALVRRGGVSLVWLIPLLALAIGVWLAVKTLAEQGPTIHIEFKTASGLAAGQTKVKFKDVEVGQVTAVDVSADLKTVIVTAELKHVFADFLTEKTRFWVERPRVSASGISGLETLLSGAFIALDPVTDGRPRRDFTGLEEPPLFTTSEPGRRFVLRAPTLGSLNIGSPVYYRQIQVGQVAGYALDADGQAVSIEVFVSSPHDALVSPRTRFWNASGIDFSLSSAGVKVDTLSLLSVLIGGVSFDTPETIAATPLGASDQALAPGEDAGHFMLYSSRAEAYAKTYARKERYLLFFDGSVRGLAIGAPVLLKGIDLGRVLDVQLQFSVEDAQFRLPVLIEIEPDRIAILGDSGKLEGQRMVERLVETGLRGQLKSSSLLTGELYVDLDVYPEAKPARVARHGDYGVIPTLPAQLEALTTQLANILDKLERLPLDRIGEELSQTVAGANALINSPELKRTLVELEGALVGARATAEQLNDRIAPELALTLQQTAATLKATSATISENSAVSIEMRRMFQEVSTAARSVRLMADYLERHPEALLKGKGR